MKKDINEKLYDLINEICKEYYCRACPYTEEVFGTYGEGSVDACEALERISLIAYKNY